jgi:hypothetical protein
LQRNRLNYHSALNISSIHNEKGISNGYVTYFEEKSYDLPKVEDIKLKLQLQSGLTYRKYDGYTEDLVSLDKKNPIRTVQGILKFNNINEASGGGLYNITRTTQNKEEQGWDLRPITKYRSETRTGTRRECRWRYLCQYESYTVPVCKNYGWWGRCAWWGTEQRYGNVCKDRYNCWNTNYTYNVSVPYTDYIQQLDDAGRKNYTTTWSGFFYSKFSGIYKFMTSSNDASYVYINGVKIIDNGGTKSEMKQVYSDSFEWNADNYWQISILFTENTGYDNFIFKIFKDDQEINPNGYLFSTGSSTRMVEIPIKPKYVKTNNIVSYYYYSLSMPENYNAEYELSIANDESYEILLVGAGGSGSVDGSGGGGGGEIKFHTNRNVDWKSGTEFLLSAGTYKIQIGSGGKNGLNGTNTRILNSSNGIILESKGGTAGALKNKAGTSSTGGGGGGGYGGANAGGTSTTNGGSGGKGSTCCGGGGGGGADVSNNAGGDASATHGGVGGKGVTIDITETTSTYGGGGGGGSTLRDNYGTASHGGGRGGGDTDSGRSGNYGSGGGGGGKNKSGNVSFGGGGILIIRKNMSTLGVVEDTTNTSVLQSLILSEKGLIKYPINALKGPTTKMNNNISVRCKESSVKNNGNAWKLFNYIISGNNNNSYFSADNYNNGVAKTTTKMFNGYAGEWIMIDFGQLINLNKIKIYPRITDTNKAPGEFRIYATDDESKYNTESNIDWGQPIFSQSTRLTESSYNNAVTITINNPTPYRFYAFVVNKLSGNANHLNFNELEFYHKPSTETMSLSLMKQDSDFFEENCARFGISDEYSSDYNQLAREQPFKYDVELSNANKTLEDGKIFIFKTYYYMFVQKGFYKFKSCVPVENIGNMAECYIINGMKKTMISSVYTKIKDISLNNVTFDYDFYTMNDYIEFTESKFIKIFFKCFGFN